MMQIHDCDVCNSKGKLKVKRKGFKREYFIRCPNCKNESPHSLSPDLAILLWNNGWIFDGIIYQYE